MRRAETEQAPLELRARSSRTRCCRGLIALARHHSSAMASKGNSLRDRQISSLKKILNLNETIDSSEADESQASALLAPVGPILDADGNPIWKVLVFDDLGRDVISSVMRVSDLRSMGITMHMHISSARHPIPDVPVIYLVEPTARNLQGITNDLQRGLYSPAYINFLSSLPRVLLEDFATQTASAGTSDQIAQLFDQYLNFIVAEPDLFSLGMQKQHTYWALNSARTSDEELEAVVDRVVSGLFSVVVTMGVIPIIRCPKGAAAEMVAARLDRKLRDHILNSKDNLFSGPRQAAPSATPSSRPVLILLDRNVDLVPMLSHSWTYQSLVHDVLDMKLNRITIETANDENNAAKGTTKKSYDLSANDFFWAKNAGVPFPQVAEDIDAELTKYKEDTASITKKTGVTDLEDLQADTSASAQHLKAAITLLPEMRERKGILDMHMNILAALLSGIKDRQLDNFFQVEENVMKQPKSQMMDLIKDDNRGKDPTDKLRLFIIWFLSTEQEVSRTDFEAFGKALEVAGADVSCLAYIRQVRATTKMTQLTTINNNTSNAGQQASSDLFGRFSSISSRLTDRLKETGVPTGLSSNFESLISGVKNFLPADRDLTVTKIVESIMDPSTAASSAMAKTEHYLYFDPRSANARGTMPPPSTIRAGSGAVSAPGGMPGAQGGPGQLATFGQRRQGFSEAMVFVVGGGSMEEYGNLQEWVSRTGGDRGRKRVVYGSTELVNAKDFIREELQRLDRMDDDESVARGASEPGAGGGVGDEGGEEGGGGGGRGRSSGYRSWKKKYRKMRIMPPERRIDVSLPSTPCLFSDVEKPSSAASIPLKRLVQLLDEVPHSSYRDAKDARCPYLADLTGTITGEDDDDGDDAGRPANFLSADDIDNYVHAIDTAIDPEAHIPTLAPRAHSGTSTNPVLKNPTSVTNWLRKNAPKIFLQDAEHNHHRNTSAEEDPDATAAPPPQSRTKARKNSTSAASASAPVAASSAAAAPRSERSKSTTKSKRSRPAPEVDTAVEDAEGGDATPSSSAAAAARGKRKRDDDAGYRPSGSSSRPAKKKRKSDVEAVSSSSASRSKKENAAAATGSGKEGDD
ncbi:hypothetical protein CP532_0411 [Ophiocordyceps camponoti-leonardi (nom. inval.)]|nr:hypothetical protein CP532_0411 [Ophiocordyceps camponoti-leonardi (nom. inval.)]